MQMFYLWHFCNKTATFDLNYASEEDVLDGSSEEEVLNGSSDEEHVEQG
jgi:hypothetical protein